MSYAISPEKRITLERAFLGGKSLREASRIAQVSKGTATRLRLSSGGLEAYRLRGAKFKQNRWG